jgi:hypothetical protein
MGPESDGSPPRTYLCRNHTIGAVKPVPGLQQQDFTLLDNHQPQKIASLQAVEGRTARAPVHVMLMLYTLNNSFQNVAYERKAMEKYLGQNQGYLSYPVSIALLSDSGVDAGQSSRDGNALIGELKKRPTPVHMIGSAEGFNGANRRFKLSIREFNRLATNQEDVPGRVILVWVGPGWPLLDEPGVVQASARISETPSTPLWISPLDFGWLR